MYLDILNSPNSPQQIYHPKYTSLSRKKEIKLYDIFQNYFNKTLIEDVICGKEKTIRSVEKFERTSLVFFLLQRGTYDIKRYHLIKMNIKLQSHSNISSINHQLMRRYHTH